MGTTSATLQRKVFAKTAKGQAEIADRIYQLNAKQRRVLIVVDGRKTRAALDGLLPTRELDEVIAFLLQQAFIEQTN